MRRTHWWGAVTGAGLLAGSVLMAPAATAAPAPAPAAVQAAPQSLTPAASYLARGPKKPSSANTKYGKPRYGAKARDCDFYAKPRTPYVTATAPKTAKKGQVVKVGATVSVKHCDCAGLEAGLYVSNGEGWQLVDTAVVGRGGKVSFSFRIFRTSLVKVVAAAGDDDAPGKSKTLSIAVKDKKKRGR